MKKAIIDQQCRIVIPAPFRKQMRVGEGSAVFITFENNSVVIRSEKTSCRRCGSFVEGDNAFPLCTACVEEIKKTYA